MDRPSWRDDSLGTRARVALWLLDEVGLGEVFTKARLRSAFPQVEQIDRRMRELRPRGWEIQTARDDPRLALDELRFATVGEPVWSQPEKRRTFGARQRSDVLERDGFACVNCGISAGETYPEMPFRRARLTVTSKGNGNDDASGYATECDACRAGKVPRPDLDRLAQLAIKLSAPERALIRRLAAGGRDPKTPLAKVWAEFRRSDPRVRAAFVHQLDQEGAGEPAGE